MNRLSERSIRFLHLADLHFGMENHGRIDPETGMHSRLLDFSATLGKILDQALEMEIDAVLFAGDAYRTGRPTPTQERELARHIERIGRAGLPLVMITGNHDLPASSGQAHAIEVFRTLELPHLYLTDRLETLHVPTRRGTLQVICLPYPARRRFADQAGTNAASLSGDKNSKGSKANCKGRSRTRRRDEIPANPSCCSPISEFRRPRFRGLKERCILRTRSNYPEAH
jgi:exonuclease SbcD